MTSVATPNASLPPVPVQNAPKKRRVTRRVVPAAAEEEVVSSVPVTPVVKTLISTGDITTTKPVVEVVSTSPISSPPVPPPTPKTKRTKTTTTTAAATVDTKTSAAAVIPELFSEPEAPPAAVVQEEEEEKTPVVKTPRRANMNASKEKFLENFESLYNDLEQLLTSINQKTLMRRLKSVRNHLYNRLKFKTSEKVKKDSTNSGFMKPVTISPALEKFLLLNNGVLPVPVTRAILTTRLCEYIKCNNLQNPDDKRVIIPDPALCELFHIDESDVEPLTYYNIQKRIQQHIFTIKTVTPPVVCTQENTAATVPLLHEDEDDDDEEEEN